MCVADLSVTSGFGSVLGMWLCIRATARACWAFSGFVFIIAMLSVLGAEGSSATPSARVILLARVALRALMMCNSVAER